MSPLTLILLCTQACFLQTVFSQCTGFGPGFGMGIPNSLYGGVGYGNMLGYGNLGFGVGLGGLGGFGLPNLVPTLGPALGPAMAPNALGPYGGVGTGLLRVGGELPVSGTTVVAGQVPIIGAVQFGGNMPAFGTVVITGSCGCGCGCKGPYLY